ncbi:MAG TPA: glycosyltransferase family 1 protein [Acidimicrobiia bacterium]|nr:glycosyltransferase family 1 protein [Acidimicrobiia bacterium]
MPGDAPVAIDVTPMIGPRTGIGNAVAEILRAVSALEDGPRLVPYALSVRARQMRADVPATTHFVPIPARVLLRSWTRLDAPRIDRFLGNARVLHATNYLAPPSRLPTLITVHDCSFVRYPELCTPEVRAFEPILRRALTRGATIHTVSEFIADDVEEVFGRDLRAQGKLVVIPWGVPPLGPESAMPEALATRIGARPYVLAIGTLEPRKNLAQLVSAFGEIAADLPDLLLVLAGRDGPARPAVDAAIARLPQTVQQRVILAGGVSDPARRALLERATAVAYPSIYEGFGFPTLEAMSVGVPVVAARAGAVPEVTGDAAVLVDATDEQALGDAIARLVTDEPGRAALIARGWRQAARYSWRTTATALADCYAQLAGRA